MSTGRPGNSITNFTVLPPDRGSFPLDHEGECKQFMTAYLKCLKSNKNENKECRHLTKQYLKCRMDKGLMEKDEWDNLGLSDVAEKNDLTASSVPVNKHG